MDPNLDDNTLLTPAEAAKVLHVNAKTVTRWTRDGKVTASRTMGGHRRFRVGDLRSALAAANAPKTEAPKTDDAG